MINVDINMGVHTMKVPHGIKKMFVDMIESLGITQGNFKINLGRNIRGNQRGLKLIKVLPEICSMEVKAQPSVKEGRHVCIVKFPDIYKKQLPKFAKMLQKKVGQEDLVDDELAEYDQGESTNIVAVQPGIELPESTLLRQQEFLAETEFFTVEMQALIVSNIFDEKATGWIEKKGLFKLLDSLKLEFPSRKLIGRLLRLGYLEDDKENPGKRSRLTPQACILIGKLTELPAPASTGVVIREEDSVVLNIFESLKELADTHASLSKELNDALNDKNRISDANMKLKEKLKSITELTNKKIEENDRIILEKNAQAELLANSITPRMIEASRRLELMYSELPTI